MEDSNMKTKLYATIRKQLRSSSKTGIVFAVGIILATSGLIYQNQSRTTDKSPHIFESRSITNNSKSTNKIDGSEKQPDAPVVFIDKSTHDNKKESEKDDNKTPEPKQQDQDHKIEPKKCDISTIKIGTQCWMKTNLNVGTMINGSIDQTNNSIIEKYCYDNDPANCATYGGLYQWNEMMQYSRIESVQGICPNGFHLPSDSEWKTMEMFLGMTQLQADAEGNRGTDQGAQILMGGTSGLDFPITGYSGGGLFYGINFRTWIWTSSQSNSPLDWAWLRGPQWGQISRDLEGKAGGMPARCIQSILVI